jgi:hypothetical protein
MQLKTVEKKAIEFSNMTRGPVWVHKIDEEYALSVTAVESFLIRFEFDITRNENVRRFVNQTLSFDMEKEEILTALSGLRKKVRDAKTQNDLDFIATEETADEFFQTIFGVIRSN